MIRCAALQSREVLHLDNLIIGGIAMPRTRSLTIGGDYEAKESTMASGKVVRDVVGWRVKLQADWEWLPAGVLAQIVVAARSGGFIEIRYPDSTGADTAGLFSIEIGSQKIFKFVDGAPYWYNVSLTASAQEVI